MKGFYNDRGFLNFKLNTMKQPINIIALPYGYFYTYEEGKLIAHQKVDPSKTAYIYVTSDVEPIKEGDWFYVEMEQQGHLIMQLVKNMEVSDSIHSHKTDWVIPAGAKKIIAANNPKLTKCSMCGMEDGEHKMSCKTPSLRTCIPQVSQTFLEEFVKNPNEEWEVEYGLIKDRICMPNCKCEEECLMMDKIFLKLNKNNTVNITSMNKKSNIISRLDNLIEDFEMLRDGKWQPDKHSITASIDNINWIKENL